MPHFQVDEQSTAFVTVTLLDDDGNPAQPTSATYEIHDQESNTEIRADAAVSPAFVAGVSKIPLNKVDNTLVDQTKAGEFREVTVHAIYSANDELHGKAVYEVVNLTFHA